MTIINRRGAYMGFEHDRASDWAWLAAWQPSVVRLMLPGSYTDPASVSVEKVRRVHDTVPDATILLRCWDVDDRKGAAHAEMGADPFGFAQRQVDWWSVVADRCTGVPRERLMAGLNNEVNVDRYGAQLFDYTTAAMRRAAARGLRLGVGMFSVGTPGKPGESPYDMTFFSRWEEDIVRGRHALVVHEYMQPEGMYGVWIDPKTGEERHDWQNLINRHVHWPMPRAPKIIGEWGIEGLLFGRHVDPVYGHSGWLNFPELWPATRLGDEYVACCKAADPTVMAICQFVWDIPDPTWNSFSPEPAAAELLARRSLCEVAVQDAGEGEENTVHIPVVVNHTVDTPPAPVPPPDETPPADGDNWARSLAFVKRWEGGYQNVANDSGNWTSGVVGVGENKGTNWGISAASYPDLDIKNLSREEAHAIFQRDYWIPSGAAKLAWPACLVVLDTAILHGVGTATAWQAEVGTNAFAFAAKRLRVYTDLSNWDYWGKAWILRVADLLEECALNVGAGS